MPHRDSSSPAAASARRLHLTLTTAMLWILATPAPSRADLDAVFVLDTTGSMGGEIQEVQQRVRQLAVSLGASRPGEQIRYGIVAFRDRGDTYITRESPLTTDVAATGTFLDQLRADGGGDGPESVLAGLAAALDSMAWATGDGTDRQVFLVGDAPAHLDYPDGPTLDDVIASAREGRIVIHTIGCRSLPPEGVTQFRRLAYATEGSYQHIGRLQAASPGTLTAALARSAAPARDDSGGEAVAVTLVDDGPADVVGLLVRQGDRLAPTGASLDDECSEESQTDGQQRSPVVGQGSEQPGGQNGVGWEIARPCTLEVWLPTGLALRNEPRLTLRPDRLRVELALGHGAGDAGSLQVWELATCPELATPVQVVLGSN